MERKQLNDLVYVQYNRKITTRFEKLRVSGKGFDPLVIEDFQWENEWVGDDPLWSHVDDAMGVSDAIMPWVRPMQSGHEMFQELHDKLIKHIVGDVLVMMSRPRMTKWMKKVSQLMMKKLKMISVHHPLHAKVVVVRVAEMMMEMTSYLMIMFDYLDVFLVFALVYYVLMFETLSTCHVVRLMDLICYI